MAPGDARERRRQEAQEKAAKIPVKITLPTVMFMFPTLFLLLLGPIGIDIIDTFSNSAEQIFGYYSDEIAGKNIKILMPKPIALEHDFYLEKYVPGSPSTIVGKKRIVDAVRSS